jgi:hypothetical protein
MLGFDPGAHYLLQASKQNQALPDRSRSERLSASSSPEASSNCLVCKKDVVDCEVSFMVLSIKSVQPTMLKPLSFSAPYSTLFLNLPAIVLPCGYFFHVNKGL